MTEKAFRYRFYPTEEQEQLLRRTLGCVRFVYNKALHTRREGWYERQERIDYKQTSAMLTDWKKQQDLQFLNEVSSVPLQQGLRNLHWSIHILHLAVSTAATQKKHLPGAGYKILIKAPVDFRASPRRRIWSVYV